MTDHKAFFRIDLMFDVDTVKVLKKQSWVNSSYK